MKWVKDNDHRRISYRINWFSFHAEVYKYKEYTTWEYMIWYQDENGKNINRKPNLDFKTAKEAKEFVEKALSEYQEYVTMSVIQN